MPDAETTACSPDAGQRPRCSVIVPAHNESAVIVRGLRALTDGAARGELEIIVVANGCTDDTAEKARAFAHPDVRVIETEVGSKTNALNLGDAAASCFPRFYLDADVVLRIDDIRRMIGRLEQGDVLAVCPLIDLDLSRSSWAVRAFYDIDQRMPSHRGAIGGSGVYGLSERGRRRFEEFPNITADDGFVGRSFSPDERSAVEGCRSRVTPPRHLPGVVTIKSRSHFGNYELDRRFPSLRTNTVRDNRGALICLAARPWFWPQLAVYLYVKVAARFRARRRIRSGNYPAWERDDTSREPVDAARTAAVSPPQQRAKPSAVN